MFSKTYELPLSRDYVRHWGVVEGIRELLQNALDSESPLEYSWSNDNDSWVSLKITSKYSSLAPKTLLLGLTSKAEAKDKIGSFGEGYKIAILVLTREGKPVTIENNGLKWTPSFQRSKVFDEEVLMIEESKHPEGRGRGLSFIISDLSRQDKDNIIDCTLHMQKSIGVVIETPKGQILRDRPGKLYVDGLFVCETENTFGYNMKPEFLKLERDRQTVDSFDLAWLTKDMWFSTGLNDEIAQLMADKAPDLVYADHGTPEVVKEACYKHFLKAHPGSILAKTQQELETLVEKGMTKVVFLGSTSYTRSIHASANYVSTQPTPVTPNEAMKKWFTDHRQYMRTPAIVSFKALVKGSENWRVK